MLGLWMCTVTNFMLMFKVKKRKVAIFLCVFFFISSLSSDDILRAPWLMIVHFM